MSQRMQDAMTLADHAWAKAVRVDPDFVEEFFRLCEGLLVSRPIVQGDAFRRHCKDNGLFLPSTLHPNTWVSGVRALYLIGWIVKAGKVEPTEAHNHMNDVTLWHSTIFGKP